MSFKVIDATTAQVIAAYTESAKTTSWGITPGFLLWGNSSVVGALAHFEKNSPATYAVLAAINKGVYDVVMGLKEEAWAGAIMDVSEDGVYVTGGEGAGLKVGMTLMASSKGKDLTDPTTGQAIHTEGHELGSLTIDKVYDKYAVAHPADGCQPVHKGDIIRIKE